MPGGQWGNGGMGNAKWTGARLSDLLDKAGVKDGAVEVVLVALPDSGTTDAAPAPSMARGGCDWGDRLNAANRAHWGRR